MGAWKSYSDAAAAGFSNIRTRSEFDRGGSDKQKYGTYQAYLDAMYLTYGCGGDEETPAITKSYPVETVSPVPVPTTTPSTTTPTTTPSTQISTDTATVVDLNSESEAKEESEEKVNEEEKDGNDRLYFPIDSGYAKKAYDKRLAAIEEQRAYAEKLAEQARQEAIKNAYVNYDRSLSTYGQNAERLAQMGLSNSGYGDYLNGVAYSSMVGGVQDAHKTANEAVERAYYNASQQKAEAADTLYNRQLQEEQIRASERAEQAQLLASVYSAVSNGDMSSEEANTILRTYGIGSTANGGNTGNGGTPADTDISDNTDIQDTIKNVAEEQAYNNLVSQITAAMTDADIDALTDNLETRVKLKVKRDEARLNDTLSDIEINGATTKVIEVADLFISEGKKTEGQKIYFANDLKLTQEAGDSISVKEVKSILENHRRDTRLSERDYNNLLKYLDKKTQGGVINADKTKNRYWDDIAVLGWGGIITALKDKDAFVTIDGEKYRVNIDDSVIVRDSEQEKYNDAAGNYGNIIKQGGDYYIKIKEKWYKVKDAQTETGFFEAVTDRVAANALVHAPTYNQENYNP